jgi:hypothetical protein
MSSVDDGKLRFLDEPSGGAERKQVRPKGNWWVEHYILKGVTDALFLDFETSTIEK